MPVSISVTQIRRALYHADQATGTGSPSLALLGTWFHEALHALIGQGNQTGLLADYHDFGTDPATRRQRMLSQLYDEVIGPRLSAEQALLQHAAVQVDTLWNAIQTACDWLMGIQEQFAQASSGRRALVASSGWQMIDWCQSEQTIACELQQPGWADRVRLVGIADAILRRPGTNSWCVVEFKLGQTAPTADLGQACLYHLILSRLEAGSAAAGDLSVVSFRPERHERFFTGQELAPAIQSLVDLIGKLAGVDARQALPSASEPAPQVPESRKILPVGARDVLPTAVHEKLGKQLVAVLTQYGVQVSLDQAPIVGPTFVRFPIGLGRGIKVAAVTRLAAELQVHLHLKAEPFISLDGGQLVIDVQRPDREVVPFSSIQSMLPTPDPLLGSSKVPVGMDLFRRMVFADLSTSDHSHILVAGTTGSGKSEWLRLAIAGLIAGNTPETLRLLIIDPKRNAFHMLKDSPFLWQPLVFPDEHSVPQILMELAEEMDQRYRLFDGADSIRQLVERTQKPIPRIVCVCDEYRDLINRNRAERKLIEEQICRLGAKARAAGIHLILATQEPSRDTVKGPLDSNIPARVGLKMGKSLESRMLLNQSGAEKLLGHGDLLFKAVGEPRRLQAPLLEEADRARYFQAGS